MWTEYLYATSVSDALEKLRACSGAARIIAGGTDLVLQSERGQSASGVVVDITCIPGLSFIEERDGWVLIGPLVTFAQASVSPLIRQRAGLLAIASGHVGGPQIRNAATIAGNVVNAQPAADGAIALSALDAELEIAEIGQRHWIPIGAAYRGVGDSGIDSTCQMVTGIRFRPLAQSSGYGYQRLSPRRALTLPSVVVAVVVETGDGVIRSARIAVGPVAPAPFRALDAEGYLAGKPASEAISTYAGELAALRAEPRDSLIRGSREYRTAMVSVLVKRALMSAFSSCSGRGEGG
jgi:CO/xanthine dehydrogenase FAD-binding subunit